MRPARLERALRRQRRRDTIRSRTRAARRDAILTILTRT